MSSIQLMKKFTDDNKGLFSAFFIVNILTLFLETIVLSYILSNVYKSKKITLTLLIQFIIIYSLMKIGLCIRSYIYDLIVPKYYTFLKSNVYDDILDRYKVDDKDLNIGYVLYNFQHLPGEFNRLIMEILQEYIPDIIAIILCIICLTYSDKYVGLIAIITIICFSITIYYRTPENINLSNKEHETLKNDNEFIQNKINNLFTIYTSGTENDEKKEYRTFEDSLESVMFDNYLYNTKSQIIYEFLCIMAMLFIFIRSRTLINFVFILIVSTRFITYVSKISQNLTNLVDIIGYIKLSDEFLNEIQKDNKDNGETTVDHLNGMIKLNNIRFNYDEKDNLFDNLNLIVKNNEKIAIFGKSGSGKSTLMKLLLGFYQTKSGVITIDNKDIKTIPVEDLRKNISVVSQVVKIFDGSIIDNIIYGTDYSKEDAINKFKNILHIFDNIGINTNLTVNGSQLSGGQKQVISILRALLKNSPILLLDEPTVGLDKSTKKKILDIISKTNKTIIYITHDNEVKKYVNTIYSLRDGKLYKISK